MLLYLTSNQKSNLIDPAVRNMTLPAKKLVGRFSLKSFVTKDMRNYANAKFFVVDAACIEESGNDFTLALQSFQMMFSARIIVILSGCEDVNGEVQRLRTAARPATSIPYALTCPALTSRKMSLCRKMMRLMNPRQCNRKVLLRIPVTPLIPHLGSSLPLCRQRIPTPLQMALKQKSGGRIAARFVCGLGGSPFLYPLEPYR